MGRKKYVYLEFSINTIILGKVYFELFCDEEIKKSVDNFLNLCRGNIYHSIYSDEMLTYKNCRVEKIKKNKCIKSGYLRDKISNGNRLNNNISKETKYEKVECIYGKSYKKEYSKRRHLSAGLLTMVAIEDKKYSSIFKITLNKVHKYNNKNIIIGRVIKNMHILRALEMIPVTTDFKPKIDVYISDCNEISESFFKSDKISSRQLYIDNLFANLNEKKNNEDDEEEEEEEEEEQDGKYFHGNNDDYSFGKFQSKKKKKKEITEKQKGIELLNKILSDIDNIAKNKSPINENNKISLDNLKESVNIITNENEVSTNKISKESVIEKHENEKDKIKNKDILPIYPYEYNEINKKMTEREKKLLNIQLKINQSKVLNQMEVQREKLFENSNNEMRKFREYLNYKNEQNINIKNAIFKKDNKNESSKDKNVNNKNDEKNEENNEETSKNEKIVESNKNEKLVESNKNEKIVESNKNEKLVESNKNEKIVESCKNEKLVESSKNENIVESSDEENKKNYKLYNTSAMKVKNIMMKKKRKNAFDLDNDIDFYKKIKFNFSINRKIYDEKKKEFGDNFYGNNLLINDNSLCTENDKNKILEFCKKQEELRSKYSRKRNEENELFKNYINRRNKIYNKKLDRYFNKHTIEIRQNLERTI
ncbi:peptidyl-prolyl cis-trans isomerase, putative [Plasmodium gallinaceum]|uniref:Peptidyl-prolyl cis-trans isomerase, putative n=1 Tax=Plasmodium gallinaceum TaxID=5849 RepID=A0A1J1GPZ0_PLAGA|nr:peptidyl-prolyl cis-trans isomerase, putative [Plasmodium gallinaceum]CRG93090.1 peptidyl-prolyl cis-trans isomerase, putative [Plasmodium gallinaceum]